MIRRILSSALVAIALIAAPARAQAQAAPASSVSSVSVAGPSASSAQVAARAQSSATPLRAAEVHAGMGRNVALMVVGAAGILAGAVVGGDSGHVIMIGGAVIGLIGLYQFLR